MPTARLARGDIAFFEFPHTDPARPVESRRCLVLKVLDHYDDVIVCMLTARPVEGTPNSISIAPQDLLEGEFHMPTSARFDRLATLSNDSHSGKKARLHPKRVAAITQALSALLG